MAIKSRCTVRCNEVQSGPVSWILIPNKAARKFLIFGFVEAMNTTLILLITWLMTLESATTRYGMEGRSEWHEFVERITHRSAWGNIPSLAYKK